MVRRLVAPLRSSGTALVVVAPSLRSIWAGAADVQLEMERAAWLERYGDVYGLQVQVTVTRNRLGREGGRAVFEVRVDEFE